MKLAKPFIQLPFTFDVERLRAELEQLPASAWMPHPNRMPGNSAVALISSGGGDNNSFEGQKAPTPHLQSCPYMQQVMASFDTLLSRSRLMKLEAGAQVQWHVDFNYHWYSRVRIHIPIVTHPNVAFHCGDEQRHMGAGECWIFDSWRRHSVNNGSDLDRVHLVIDTTGSSAFWNCVRQAEAYSEDELKRVMKACPYEPGKVISLKTERFASQSVMAPGECHALVEDLITDFTANPDNDSEWVAKYTVLLRNFVADWQECWLLYADQPQMRAHYRTLLGRTRRALHPNPRILTTASNDIGVNPIFVQRVLSAALGGELN